ncbi:ABC transporter permease [Haloarchaeobius litoreus]|uniref:ABC transporter permease n=1 Tax=Haloarchaeobius litoreus TaxID=755306 RepID=A0ABD6DRT2_9EURY|nr:ABC transporter permease subunit [Haloarchaeobius litoreus]
MSWQFIARQDWSDTADQRSTKTLLALVSFVVLLSGYVYPVLTEGPHTTATFSSYAVGWLTTLVPLVGVLLGYGAVVSERESGSLLLSLSLPISREDVVVGKYVSRTGLLAATIAGSMTLAGSLVVYPFGTLDLLPFLGFVVLTVLFGAVWTGIGIAVSLLVSTKRRALVLGVTVFFLLVIVWDTVVGALGLALEALGFTDGELPDPLQFVVGLEPGRLFRRITEGFIDPSATVDGAWYLSEWIALALFAAWLVGPLGLAYLRFSGVDL